MKIRSNVKEIIRYNIINVLIWIIGAILLIQLFNLQIIHGEEYRETSNTRLTRETTIKAARGNILDSLGNKLVTTKTGYSLELYKTKIDTQTLNRTILKIIELLENNGDKYVDNLPIKVKPYSFTYDNKEKQKEWKREYNINENATPEECFKMLKKEYEILEDDIEKVRKIMAIRYEISKNGFGSIRPITVAKDINYKSVNQIEEQKKSFPGVSVKTEPIITYPYKNLASHVLGYVGAISPEEYNENKDKYDINDYIGKIGIQYSLEEYLKGQDGISQIDMSVDGEIKGEYVTKEAVSGNDVVLTIDANLQSKVEEILKEEIENISNGKYGEKYNAKAGSAIVMNIKNGEILALANYPDYEPELFISGISEQKNAEYEKGKNLYNRAISSEYAPGSTFKMVSATAALETKTITPTTKINDTGVYPKGHNPVCWYYTKHHYGHGYLNVIEAIKKSCNYFFYEIGDKIGINKIAEYANLYGLGRKTGIELLGESKGIVASPKYKKEVYGEEWQYGETLSAVIGQSYNSYTPIQMARYIAMLVNGGNPIDVTLIKNVVDNNGEIIPRSEVKQNVDNKLKIDNSYKMKKINLKEETVKTILKGMKGVTSEPGGTAYYIFSDLGVDIGGKTGSAETGDGGKVNGWFTGFAPYDEPEIAIVVLIENAGSGGNVANTAKRIIKEYLRMNTKDIKEDTNAIPNIEINR